MRIIFKILAAPFVLVLTLLVAVLSFLLSLSAGLLSILASVLGLLSVLMLFVEKDISTGIAGRRSVIARWITADSGCVTA